MEATKKFSPLFASKHGGIGSGVDPLDGPSFPVDETRAAIMKQIASGTDSVEDLKKQSARGAWPEVKQSLGDAYVDGLVDIEGGRVRLTSLGRRAVRTL